MTKILAMSDLHENLEFLDIVIRNMDFDALFMAGDITELHVPTLAEILHEVSVPIVIITGNHDCVPCMVKLAKKIENMTYVFRGLVSVEIDGLELNILGISGVYSRKKRDLFHFNDRDILSLVRKILNNEVEIDIVMTHTAPYKMADFLPKGGRGGLRQFLVFRDVCRPKIWISGHTHVLASEKVMDTLAVNCGLGYIGDLALINLKEHAVILGRLYRGEIPDVESPTWDFLYYLRRVKSYTRILREESKLLFP